MTEDSIYELTQRLRQHHSRARSRQVEREYRKLLVGKFNEHDVRIPCDWSTLKIEELAEVNGLDTEKLYREFLEEKLEELEEDEDE